MRPISWNKSRGCWAESRRLMTLSSSIPIPPQRRSYESVSGRCTSTKQVKETGCDNQGCTFEKAGVRAWCTRQICSAKLRALFAAYPQCCFRLFAHHVEFITPPTRLNITAAIDCPTPAIAELELSGTNSHACLCSVPSKTNHVCVAKSKKGGPRKAQSCRCLKQFQSFEPPRCWLARDWKRATARAREERERHGDRLEWCGL